MPSKVPDSRTATRIFTSGRVGALLGAAWASIRRRWRSALPGDAATEPRRQVDDGGACARQESAATLAEILRGGAPASGIASGLMAPLLAGP